MLLQMRLYSLDGVDLDRIAGFHGVPPPVPELKERLVQEGKDPKDWLAVWREYRKGA